MNANQQKTEQQRRRDQSNDMCFDIITLITIILIILKITQII